MLACCPMSDYGWLSILPPVLAIAMALRTRQVYMSLFGGILLGTTMLAGWNLLAGMALAIEQLVLVLNDHDNAEVRNGANTREIDIEFQKKIVCGKFVDEERPTFLETMHAHYENVLGERYQPMPPEGGWIRG